MPVDGTRAAGQAPAARLRAENLRKVFGPSRSGAHQTVAVAGVSFSIDPGETFGLVGGSGAGKSTVARLVLRLLPATSGRIWIDDQEITSLRQRDLRRVRRRVQMVAQDPFQALHPGMPVRDLVAEPLVIQRLGDREERMHRVVRALEDVSLLPASSFLDRFAS